MAKFSSSGKKFHINTVYTYQSIRQLKENIDFRIHHNVDKYSIAHYYSKNDVTPDSIQRTLEMEDTLRQYIATEYPNSLLYFAVEGCMLFSGIKNFDGGVVDTEFQKMTYGCECGQAELEIVSDGTAYPCIGFFQTDYTCGNVFESGLQSVWNHSKTLGFFRNSQVEDPLCKQCSCVSFCNGGCPALRLSLSKDLLTKGDPRCFAHHQLEKDTL